MATATKPAESPLSSRPLPAHDATRTLSASVRRSLERDRDPNQHAPAVPSRLGLVSANASDLSLADSAAAEGTPASKPLSALRGTLDRLRTANLSTSGAASGAASATASAAASDPPSATGGTGVAASAILPAETPVPTAPPARDRTDAIWAAMQRALQEVEATATAGRGAQLFGAQHPAALGELRAAQVALAQAWARGEDDLELPAAAETAAHVTSDWASGKSPGASASGDDHGRDTAEADMAAARRRREASDRYFDRVSRQVAEVTQKLEEVAVAMGKVEEESREGWSEGEDEDEEEAMASDSTTS